MWIVGGVDADGLAREELREVLLNARGRVPVGGGGQDRGDFGDGVGYEHARVAYSYEAVERVWVEGVTGVGAGDQDRAVGRRSPPLALEQVPDLVGVESGSRGHRAQSPACLNERLIGPGPTNLQAVGQSLDLQLLAASQREPVS